MSDLGRFLDPNLVQQLNQLQLTARSVVEGITTGQHRSRLKGASVEFRQHRSYTPGDEPRRLDWRVLARTDRPYVREFQEETNLRAVILLDRSGSLGYGRQFGSKFDYSRKIAAALSYLLLGQTESIGMAIFGNRIERWLAPQAHESQLSRILEILEDSSPGGASAPHVAMHELATRLGRRSLVIVLSDFFAPLDRLRNGLARLRHDRHEVILMQVLDPDELEFPFRNFWRFRGLEGEQTSLCDTSLLRQTYLKNIARHEQGLAEMCRALGMERTRFLTEQPLDEALLTFLRRRELRR